MTDLHTHILPGVDDGAGSVEESVAMLHAEFEQGVDTVVLTPHFYPARETAADFLSRREAAFAQLKEGIQALPEEDKLRLPRLCLGAEVAYVPGLAEVPGLRSLCLGNTNNMLLELPFYPWDRMLLHQLYDFFGQVGVTPVLAHIERYFACQEKKFLDEVLELGLPVQVGTETLTRAFSPAMKLLRQGKGHLVASDCHDLKHRSPDLRPAMEAVRKKLGQERFEEMVELADQLTERE